MSVRPKPVGFAINHHGTVHAIDAAEVRGIQTSACGVYEVRSNVEITPEPPIGRRCGLPFCAEAFDGGVQTCPECDGRGWTRDDTPTPPSPSGLGGPRRTPMQAADE